MKWKLLWFILGDGDPQTYADYREQLKGAIAMVSTANPAFYHRGMHRGESSTGCRSWRDRVYLDAW